MTPEVLVRRVFRVAFVPPAATFLPPRVVPNLDETVFVRPLAVWDCGVFRY